ncbi:MAG: CaiB/BaiF CoA-transferase family protein [Pseudolabrys sp.]|nr:CaiB/BaiF CoA-transferase family protein [Pseudolabrys sp.]
MSQRIEKRVSARSSRSVKRSFRGADMQGSITERADGLPLAGAKVVDLSRLLPGPWCSQTLGDLGADVIKIEQPDIGDYGRFNPPYYREGGVYFNSVNRNKRSITLDLKLEADSRIALDLMRDADIVVESYRAGVTTKLGIDYAAISKINPGVIYCSVTGFGTDGPFALVPGHDLSIQGATGILDVGPHEGAPAMPGFQAADYAGATYATIAVLAAYIQRLKTGRGRHLDIALYDSLMVLSNIALTGAMARAAGHSGKPELEVWGNNPRYATYPTKDGKAVTVCLLEMRTWEQFCKLIGRTDLIYKETYADRHTSHGERADVFRDVIGQLCIAHDRDELVARMVEADIPICPIYSPDEALASAEARGRTLIRMADHPTEGPIPQIFDPLTRAGLADPLRRMAPGLGEHNDEIRRELSLNKAGAATLQSSSTAKR